MRQLRLERINKSGKCFYRAYIDEVYIGPVFLNDIRKAEINLIEEIDGSFEQEVSRAEAERLYGILYNRAYEKCASILATAEYSAYDIRLKLKKKDYSDILIEDVIKALYQDRFLDDRRYAEQYIRAYSKKKSRELILRELAMKGIETDDLHIVLQETYEEEGTSEVDIILDLLKKRYMDQNLNDERVRRRAAAFLIRRGFSFSDINNALDIICEKLL